MTRDGNEMQSCRRKAERPEFARAPRQAALKSDATVCVGRDSVRRTRRCASDAVPRVLPSRSCVSDPRRKRNTQDTVMNAEVKRRAKRERERERAPEGAFHVAVLGEGPRRVSPEGSPRRLATDRPLLPSFAVPGFRTVSLTVATTTTTATITRTFSILPSFTGFSAYFQPDFPTVSSSFHLMRLPSFCRGLPGGIGFCFFFHSATSLGAEFGSPPLVSFC